jgi:hypothetical protein
MASSEMQAELTVGPAPGIGRQRRGPTVTYGAAEVLAVTLAVGTAWFVLALYDSAH